MAPVCLIVLVHMPLHELFTVLLDCCSRNMKDDYLSVCTCAMNKRIVLSKIIATCSLSY